MTTKREPYTTGHLQHSAINHQIEREHRCDTCDAVFTGGVNARTCGACKATPEYRARKQEYMRRYRINREGK